MTEHGHSDAHPPAEEDVLPSGKIYLVGVLALVVFFIGSLAAGLGWRSLRQQLNPEGPPPIPDVTGQPKVGMVEQRLFEHSNMGPAWREAAHRRLASYGWVDRQKGVAHIPIDRAYELVEKGARP